MSEQLVSCHAADEGVVFLFIHYSHTTYGDDGNIMYSLFPVGPQTRGGGARRWVKLADCSRRMPWGEER